MSPLGPNALGMRSFSGERVPIYPPSAVSTFVGPLTP